MRRLYGIELECGVLKRKSKGFTSLAAEAEEELLEAFPELCGVNDHNNMLEFQNNGAKIYTVVPAGGVSVRDSYVRQLEYATPECQNIEDLVAVYMAGKRVIYKRTSGTNLILIAGSTDMTYIPPFGMQLNITVRDSFEKGKNRRIFESALATLPILTGGGAVFQGSFLISERATFLSPRRSKEPSSLVRGLCCTREGRGDSHSWKGAVRLQVQSLDPPVLELPLWLACGILTVLLESIEDGFWEDDLFVNKIILREGTMENSIRESISVNGIRTKEFLVESGCYLTGLEHQERLRELLLRWYEKSPAKKKGVFAFEKVFDRWGFFISCLKKDWHLCIGKLDWPTLRYLIEKFAARNNISDWDDNRIKSYPMFYRMITSDLSIGRRIIENPDILNPYRAEFVVSQDKISHFTEHPPVGRPEIRVRWKKWLEQVRQLNSANWLDWDVIEFPSEFYNFTKKVFGWKEGRYEFPPFSVNDLESERAMRLLEKEFWRGSRKPR